MAFLRAAGADVTVQETLRVGHATEIARGAAGLGFNVVLAAGGDGTINEVINGIYGSSVRLAVLPMGTANVLANELDLPFSARKLAETILAARTRDIWLGRMDETRCFSLMVSAGFDAEVAKAVKPRIKRLLGKGAYVLETLKAVISYRSAGFDVTIDGVCHKAASVIVSKSHFYGGRFVCAPNASIFDRTLYVSLFTKGGPVNLMRYLAALVLKRLHRLPDVLLVKARHVAISGPAGSPLQFDGDAGGMTPTAISLSGAPVQVIVPA